MITVWYYPNLAPDQVVIVPIYKGEEQQRQIAEVAEKIKSDLEQHNIRVKFDNRDKFKPGFKFNEYELKGVPLRIAIGPKDLEQGTVEVARRDTLTKTKLTQQEVLAYVKNELEVMQVSLLRKRRTLELNILLG